ncbi:RNA 3'-terminal phosphate cyclase-like protein [Amphibalanus amphitrite]|uniref:RNA 3'-terminal phosphate cyclase-like protein n=1 Tax=Amphibalanus amphitrite TaxID=1232801 RepID=A0A6A4VCV2_AMPAM|nr:RNA 3'-terminal phosphate cyclase-like protein [Amphibalanus amphitrite]
MSQNKNSSVLSYEGCKNFRMRIVLATLSGKMVKIKKIRAGNDDPGVNESEASFLRLMDKLTNGTRIEVNETGTSVTYMPGLLAGGRLEHACSKQRGLGYYLEPVMMLAPFCKKPLHLTLHGVTNSQMDPSVDQLKHSCLPILRRYLLLADEQLQLKIVRRGMAPGGGGQVFFTCPVQRTLRATQWLDPGKIKRIRGVAYAARVSPAMSSRMVDSAKAVLLKFLPDVYIYTDHYKGEMAGKSPGFGISLVAETTTGCMMTSDVTSQPQGAEGPPSVPEELGTSAAHLLLDEVYRGGCVDSLAQSMMLLYMSLGQKDVSKVKLGQLTPYTIEFLRHLRDSFQTVFRIENVIPTEEEEDLNTGGGKLTLTCLGAGFSNLSKTVS